MRLIIADTSCIILFDKIEELEILKNTFPEILVTDKVVEEYGQTPEWITVKSDYPRESFKKLSLNFGPGESSCIALAQMLDNPILLVDDRRAKKVAEEIGIECVGSLGVLLIAKREKVIDNVKSILRKIQDTDFRINEKLVDTILFLANEKDL